MRVISVVGARPQFIKLAPIHRALIARSHEHLIFHTGQHYEKFMSKVFFDELSLPRPLLNLNVGSDNREAQIESISTGLANELVKQSADWVLVYGDTNSTLGGALAAKSAKFRIAHLEAGVRSFNTQMPEELNRVLTDKISDLLLAPTEVAMTNLRNEGLGAKSRLVGDVMTDICFESKERVLVKRPPMPSNWYSSSTYVVATIHRESNTADRGQLEEIIRYLAESPISVRLLVHPRLRDCASRYQIDLAVGSIQTFEPLSYLQTIYALVSSKGLITDSGGLQKEAFLLGVPCVTLRDETEWMETVNLGWNVLDPNLQMDIGKHFSKSFKPVNAHPFGSGKAAVSAVEAMELSF